MSVVPADCMEVAEQLFATHRTEEKYLRTAVSRAYYYTYHLSVAFASHLPEYSYAGKSPGMHQQNIDRFIRCPTREPYTAFHSKIVSIGKVLQVLHDRRIAADYHLNWHLTVLICHEQILKAKAMARQLELLQNDILEARKVGKQCP